MTCHCDKFSASPCFKCREKMTYGRYTQTFTPSDTGWICPKCNNVYSPATTECIHCNSAKWLNSNKGTTNE